MGTIELTFPSDGQSGILLKWRVRVNTMVSAGRVLFLYSNVTSSGSEDVKGPEKKYRATRFGRVTKLLVKEGAVVEPGQVILLLEGCRHPTVMKDLCGECGVDLRLEAAGKDTKTTEVSQASVPMVHSIPELKVCPELAEKIGKADEERLLKDRKLVLLVDLDQTVVHTTNDNVPPNMKDVFHYQLYGPNSPWYHTRLRPNTRHFLSEMSKLYELHICTFGARNYAHTVAALLDKDGVLFSHRILSRDECFDPASKTANLKALFPCGDDLVCIIDDREDVWQGCGNLVQVKPYHFFRHTGDIHAPPGLEKNDPPSLNEPASFPELDADKTVPDDKKNGLEEVATEECIAKNEIETKEAVKEDECSETTESNENPLMAEEKDNKELIKLNNTVITVVDDNKIDDNSSPADGDNASPMDINNAETVEAKETVVDSVKDIKQDQIKQEQGETIHEDDDDYLLYLEDILRRIHAEFYNEMDKDNQRPSLRDIIPRVRARVLKGIHITFSGLIPTHQKIHQSRAYKVARAFGAEVSQDLTDKTTHLVAIRPGTAKANAAKKNPNIRIVNPDWLWTCAERWEHVDERLFPLTAKARASRIPPPHCSSPERIDEEEQIGSSFANTINPLMSFTPEEIENMDKEVDEDMDDQEMEAVTFDVDLTEEGDDFGEPNRKKARIDNESTGEENSSSEREEKSSDEDDDDDPVTRFRRGEDLPDDLDLGDNSQDSIDDLEAMDNEDDREWNAMGAALEREFLSE